MEANHPHLTTQKSFFVEISRAALKEQLETATGKRIAALEAVEPERAKWHEAGLDTGRSTGREGDVSPSPERDGLRGPEMEQSRAPKRLDRGLGL